jgi:hypothetical protein
VNVCVFVVYVCVDLLTRKLVVGGVGVCGCVIGWVRCFFGGGAGRCWKIIIAAVLSSLCSTRRSC